MSGNVYIITGEESKMNISDGPRILGICYSEDEARKWKKRFEAFQNVQLRYLNVRIFHVGEEIL